MKANVQELFTLEIKGFEEGRIEKKGIFLI